MRNRSPLFWGFVVVALILLTVALTSCGTTADSVDDTSETTIYGKFKKIDVEGTECIVFDADGGGGNITCDWDR